MCAANTDQIRVFCLQRGKGGFQPVGGGQHILHHSQHCGNVQRGGKGVVTGLGTVHMVVGVQHHAVFPGQMGNNLVDVHVGLGAAAGLPYHQRELVVPFSLPDLPANGGNGLCLLRRDAALSRVDLRAGILQIGKRGNDLFGLALPANFEVFPAALGLGAPVVFRRDGYLAHGIVFHSVFHDAAPLCDLSCIIA